MDITENTPLRDILERYPWLPGELERVEPRAKPYLAMRSSPLGKKALAHATVGDAAAFLRQPPEKLIGKLKALIAQVEDA